MSPKNSYPLELLAPARNAAIAIEAIEHGADAVYMGASMLGARAAATNSVRDLAAVCRYAHDFDARVYATVNTIIYDHELKQAQDMIWQLWEAEVDALIVQDMGLLRLDLPPIALHASTQCDIRTPEKARFLQQLGFSQLVLARELTLDEIADIRRQTRVPLEAFVHGALCVCYSGRCQLSQAVTGRSANRGECAQMCRLPYDLVDADGRTLVRDKHLLSLRDLNRSMHLRQMIEAGVSSFKIEGRLKDMSYVKNVVAYYRQALDRLIAESDGRLCRASCGSSEYTFEPDLRRSFNRSFTSYFLTERHPNNGQHMASVDTPKSMGQPIGRVKQAQGRQLTIDTDIPLANGDGLSYVDTKGQYTGARVNVAQGRTVTLREKAHVKTGTMIYRTYDKALDDTLANASGRRHITVTARLTHVDGRLALTLQDQRGCRVTHTIDAEGVQTANKSQEQRQADIIAKLGDTHYTLEHADLLPNLFIPASVLTRLRRETTALLDRTWHTCRPHELRRKEDALAPCPTIVLGSADNVANRLARRVYHEHGVQSIAPAMEVDHDNEQGTERNRMVMLTRYCLRRELGACLRTPQGIKLPRQLFLHTPQAILEVVCDCSKCEMHLLLHDASTQVADHGRKS